MPTIGGKSFQIDASSFSRVIDKIGKRFENDDKDIKRRVTRATEMIWRIAHQKRPIISAKQMGRRVYNAPYKNYVTEGRTRRVSDPDAKAGVPVHTGALQASVTQKVSSKGSMSYQGEISSKGIPYAGYIEYGTSKIRARPFMRPAVNLTQDAIKRMMGLKVESNL